jgi:hypothetical protein
MKRHLPLNDEKQRRQNKRDKKQQSKKQEKFNHNIRPSDKKFGSRNDQSFHSDEDE